MTVVLETIAAARQWTGRERSAGKTLGLVPTMGALHEGHLSLIRRAEQRCDQTMVSIFVNPLQFGPGEDYERYPRPFERDLKLVRDQGVGAVFHPSPSEIYTPAPMITVDPGKLAEVLCGASRPGHFRGVATVVAKLFHILQPDRAFFGQKDAQQVVVIEKMTEELNFPVEIEVCPTVREPDGLAMSSRNSYLSAQERSDATVLYRALRKAEELVRSGVREGARIEQEMRSVIASVPVAQLEYASVVDPKTLQPAVMTNGEALAALAVRLGRTRLIDNMILRESF